MSKEQAWSCYEAEEETVQAAQRKAFHDECEALSLGRQVSSKSLETNKVVSYGSIHSDGCLLFADFLS